MNAKNLYLLMAREVLTDNNDSMNSIIKIIDQFNTTIDNSQIANLSSDQPVTIPVTYGIASAWLLKEKLKAEEVIRVAITYVTPDGKEFEGPRQSHLIPAGIDRLSMNFQVQGLPASISGRYSLDAVIFSSEEKVLGRASYPYDIAIDGVQK